MLTHDLKLCMNLCVYVWGGGRAACCWLTANVHKSDFHLQHSREVYSFCRCHWRRIPPPQDSQVECQCGSQFGPKTSDPPIRIEVEFPNASKHLPNSLGFKSPYRDCQVSCKEFDTTTDPNQIFRGVSLIASPVRFSRETLHYLNVLYPCSRLFSWIINALCFISGNLEPWSRIYEIIF